MSNAKILNKQTDNFKMTLAFKRNITLDKFALFQSWIFELLVISQCDFECLKVVPNTTGR